MPTRFSILLTVFLTAAQPEIAIYSAGANNPYGHPAAETITRLCDVGATIYGTAVHGTILVVTDGTTYNVHTSNDVPPVICPTTHDLTISVMGKELQTLAQLAIPIMKALRLLSLLLLLLAGALTTGEAMLRAQAPQ